MGRALCIAGDGTPHFPRLSRSGAQIVDSQREALAAIEKGGRVKIRCTRASLTGVKPPFFCGGKSLDEPWSITRSTRIEDETPRKRSALSRERILNLSLSMRSQERSTDFASEGKSRISLIFFGSIRNGRMSRSYSAICPARDA